MLSYFALITKTFCATFIAAVLEVMMICYFNWDETPAKIKWYFEMPNKLLFFPTMM